MSDLERFHSKYKEAVDTGCWVWKTDCVHGYGSFWLQGKVYRAHRASYMLFSGVIPLGMNVLHTCDNPSCVNPQHLFLGTQQDNMTDKRLKGRQPEGADHVSWRGGKRESRKDYHREYYQSKIKEVE